MSNIEKETYLDFLFGFILFFALIAIGFGLGIESRDSEKTYSVLRCNDSGFTCYYESVNKDELIEYLHLH